MIKNIICWTYASVVMGTLSGCTTPYTPPIVASGAAEFPGLISLLERSEGRPVDVILVHGMCTHDHSWGHGAIKRIVDAIKQNTHLELVVNSASVEKIGKIDVVQQSVDTSLGSLRLSALIWSAWTIPLKNELSFDLTGEPTDCAAPGVCVPVKARINGRLKDELLNDCLSDALIYQGESQKIILENMKTAVSRVLSDSKPGPLVLISYSLGSKLTMDALVALSSVESVSSQVRNSVERLALVFMGANQLPLLRLSEKSALEDIPGRIPAPTPPEKDSLQRLLELRTARVRALEPGKDSLAISSINVVAFSDPNDLLSYRLQPSRYAGPGVVVSDVLVTNSSTYFGLLARPDIAHTGYVDNAGVASFIACGHRRSERCN